MTRLALVQDRGLQAERTTLAWTRTALAVAVSGALLLVRDRHFCGSPARIAVFVGTAALAAAVYAVGVHRRRQLRADPRPCTATGRRCVPAIGTAVIMEGALVLAYLALPEGS